MPAQLLNYTEGRNTINALAYPLSYKDKCFRQWAKSNRLNINALPLTQMLLAL